MPTDGADYTPLTLQFSPNNLDDPAVPDDQEPIAVVEPSMADPGRIFVGVNPQGVRVGVHLLPEDARRVRDHLSMLLLERPEDAESVESVEARLQRAVDRAKERVVAETPEQALTRPQGGRRGGRWLPSFRFEFGWGRVQAVIGTVDSG